MSFDTAKIFEDNDLVSEFIGGDDTRERVKELDSKDYENPKLLLSNCIITSLDILSLI